MSLHCTRWVPSNVRLYKHCSHPRCPRHTPFVPLCDRTDTRATAKCYLEGNFEFALDRASLKEIVKAVMPTATDVVDDVIWPRFDPTGEVCACGFSLPSGRNNRGSLIAKDDHRMASPHPKLTASPLFYPSVISTAARAVSCSFYLTAAKRGWWVLLRGRRWGRNDETTAPEAPLLNALEVLVGLTIVVQGRLEEKVLSPPLRRTIQRANSHSHTHIREPHTPRHAWVVASGQPNPTQPNSTQPGPTQPVERGGDVEGV